MFKLLTIPDIIDKHKGTPAIIECHGPSANNNRQNINKIIQKKEFIIFAINEWEQFEDHPTPHYWVKASTELTVQKHYNYFNKYSKGDIPLLSCDTVDGTSIEFAKSHLHIPYLPFDNRHFGGKTCKENFDLSAPDTYLTRYFTFFENCCNQIEKLTIQEELQKYTNYSSHYSPNSYTAAIHMVSFAVLMGCNPIYINGMDLDHFTKNGFYAKLNKGVGLENYSPPPKAWKEFRRDWISRDFNVVNKSAKNINVNIFNLNHDTWYEIFKKGYLN